MRKISTLLMLFCAFVGTALAQTPIKFADFDATKTYRVYNQKSGEDVKAWVVNSSNKGELTNYDAANWEQIWQFVPGEGDNAGKYLLYNLNTKKYLQQVVGSNGVNAGDQASAVYYQMVQKADDDTKVKFVSSNQIKNTLYNDGGGKLAGWEDENNGQHWFHLEVADYPNVVADLSELSNDKVYVVKSGRSGANSHFLLYHTDAPNNLSSTYGSGHAMVFSMTTTNFQFAIYKYDDKYYFYNIAANMFIGNADANDTAIPLTEMPTNAIQVRSSNNAVYNFVLSTNGNGALNAAGTANCHGVVNWTGGYANLTDGGNIYQIVEAGELPTATKNTIQERLEVGVLLADVDNLISKASNTLVGAYKVSAATQLAVLKEQYQANPNAENLANLKAEYDAILADPTAKVTLAPGEQFTVKCVEDSRGYMVYSTVEGKGSETQAYLAGSNRADFHAAIDAEGIYKEWAVMVHEGKTYIYNVENKKFITSDGVVQFSNTPYSFEFIDIEDALWEIKFANNRYLSFSPGWGANCVRTEPGIDNGCKFYIEKTGNTVSEEVLAVVESSFVNEWKNATLKTLGYVGGYPVSQTAAINAVNTLAKTVEYEATTERIAMAPGYYFIKKVNNSKYVTVDGINMMATADAEGINQIWKFEEITGGYSLKHANLDAFVALENAEDNGSSATKVNSAEGATFTLEHKGNAQQLLKSNGQPMRTEGGGQVNYWWGETNTTWYLIPATELDVTVTEAGYATLNLPFDVTLPNTVKAYAVETVEGNYASLVEKADIPANKGAILEGAGTHTLTIAAASSDWTNNKLVGTNVNTYVAGEAYVLGKDGEGAGFFKATLNKNEAGEEGTTHFLNNANKAYLPASAVTTLAATLRFNFGGTTAIESVLNNGIDANAAIYDLSGRRVEKAVKGIYIQNGKKIIVK